MADPHPKREKENRFPGADPDPDPSAGDDEMGAEAENSADGHHAWVTSYLDNDLAGVIRAYLKHSASGSNRDAHDDCFQSAAVLLWEIRRRLESMPPTSRDAYAYVCVRRVVRDFLIGETHWRSPTADSDGAASDGPEPAQDQGSDAVMEWVMLLGDTLSDCVERPDVLAALASLPAADSRVLDLYYLKGLSHRAIGARLGKTPEQVKMQCHRAVVRLRRRLGVPPVNLETGEKP